MAAGTATGTTQFTTSSNRFATSPNPFGTSSVASSGGGGGIGEILAGLFGGSGGFGSENSLARILNRFDSQLSSTKTATEIGRIQAEKNAQIDALFQEALAGLDSFRDIANRRFDVAGNLVKQRGIDVLESNRNFGREERRRVGDALTQSNAADESSLVSRGLGSTTVGSSLRNRNQEIARRAQMDITDRTANRETGLRLETGRDLERFIFARTEFQRSLLNERNRILEARTVAFDPSSAIAALTAGGQVTSNRSATLGTIGSLAGGVIGGIVGGPVGAAAGSAIGGSAGSLAGR